LFYVHVKLSPRELFEQEAQGVLSRSPEKPVQHVHLHKIL